MCLVCFFLQYNLGGNPNKPCNVLSFKGVSLMLDCGLDINSALHFLPLPLVTNKRLSQLPSWIPRDSSDTVQLDGGVTFNLLLNSYKHA